MRAERIPALGLGACLVGLVLSPLGFIATGALSDFSPVFSTLMLPPLLLGGAFLLRRLLARPRERPPERRPPWLLDAASWIVVAGALYLISGANLMRGLERLGAVCTFFLAGAVLGLPILLRRQTAVETRLARLPRTASLILLTAIVGLAGWAMVAYLTAPPAFIGSTGY